MFMLICISLLVYLSYIAYNYYKHFTYWNQYDIKTIPFVTFAWARMPLCQFLMERSKNGKIYGAYDFSHRMLIVNDAKMARDISVKELHKFHLRFPGDLGKSSFKHSLFFMSANEDWKRVRSIVSPAFTSGKLKSMLTPINKIVKNFIDSLEQYSRTGERFDIKIYTGAFTMDVIASCAYGIQINSLKEPNHPIVKHAKDILNVDAKMIRILAHLFPKFSKLFNIDPFEIEAINYFDELTFKIIEKRLNDNHQNKDLIGLMIEQTNTFHNDNSDSNDNNNNAKPKLKGISKEEIAGQGVIFFLAGFDTTNSTFCHVIYNLVKHPIWQEKLFEELLEKESIMEYETLRSLPLLNAVINETLRLYPPLLEIHRSNDKAETLLDTGIVIPADSTIFIQPYVIHRDPDYFPEPNEFKPERFLGENSAESNIAFMPFGLGPRLCVGMRFALNELRIVIAQLIYNYKLIADPNLKLEYYNGNLLLAPKNIYINIVKRE